MSYFSFQSPTPTPTPQSAPPAPQPTDDDTVSMDEAVEQLRVKFGIPKILADKLIRQESGGNDSAKSYAGATGRMQLMPSTARGILKPNGQPIDPNNPLENVYGGFKYLSDNYKTFRSRAKSDRHAWMMAAGAYHAGPQAVEDDLKKGGLGIPDRDDGLLNTQDYVFNIFNGTKSEDFALPTPQGFNFSDSAPNRQREPNLEPPDTQQVDFTRVQTPSVQRTAQQGGQRVAQAVTPPQTAAPPQVSAPVSTQQPTSSVKSTLPVAGEAIRVKVKPDATGEQIVYDAAYQLAKSQGASDEVASKYAGQESQEGVAQGDEFVRSARAKGEADIRVRAENLQLLKAYLDGEETKRNAEKVIEKEGGITGIVGDPAERVEREQVRSQIEGEISKAQEDARFTGGGLGGSQYVGSLMTLTPEMQEREIEKRVDDEMSRRAEQRRMAASLTPDERTELKEDIAADERRGMAYRIFKQPLQGFANDHIHMVTNVLSALGVAPEETERLKRREYMNAVASEMSHAESSPAPYIESLLKGGFGAGLNVAELLALRSTVLKVTGSAKLASLPSILGAQSLVRNADKDIGTQATEFGKAVAFGVALEKLGGISRLQGMGLFGLGEPAMALAEGERDPHKLIARLGGGLITGGVFAGKGRERTSEAPVEPTETTPETPIDTSELPPDWAERAQVMLKTGKDENGVKLSDGDRANLEGLLRQTKTQQPTEKPQEPDELDALLNRLETPESIPDEPISAASLKLDAEPSEPIKKNAPQVKSEPSVPITRPVEVSTSGAGKSEIQAEGGSAVSPEPAPVQKEVRKMPIKNGEVTVEFERSADWGGRKIHIHAYGPNREYVGGVVFEDVGDGRVQATDLFVNEPWRRRGVATALYDMAEANGYRPIPATGGRLSDAGVKFWDARASHAATKELTSQAATSAQPTQTTEAEQHHSQNQARRQRNVATGTKGQFKEETKAQREARQTQMVEGGERLSKLTPEERADYETTATKVKEKLKTVTEQPDTSKPPTRYQQTGVRRRTSFDPAEHSLTRFVLSEGGIRVDRDQTNRGEVMRLHKLRPGLINNQSGKSVEEMANSAAEAGFAVGEGGGHVETGTGAMRFNAGANAVDHDLFLQMLESDAGGQGKHYTSSREVDFDEAYTDALAKDPNLQEAERKFEVFNADDTASSLYNKLLYEGTDKLSGRELQALRGKAKQYGVSEEIERSIESNSDILAGYSAVSEAGLEGEGDTSFNFGQTAPQEQGSGRTETERVSRSSPQTSRPIEQPSMLEPTGGLFGGELERTETKRTHPADVERNRLIAREAEAKRARLEAKFGDYAESVDGLTRSSDPVVRRAAENLINTSGRQPKDAAIALKKLADLRARGETVDEYARQGDMFGDRLTEQQIRIMRGMEQGGLAKLTPEERADYEKAVASLKQKTGSANTLFADPYGVGKFAEVLPDLVKIGQYHVKNGAREFADFAREMKREFGDAIEPILKKIHALALKEGEEASGQASERTENRGTTIRDTGQVGTETPVRQDSPLARVSTRTEDAGREASMAEAGRPTPAEITDAPKPTGIKNEVKAQERAARGLDPVEVEGKRAFGVAWDTAREQIQGGRIDPVVLTKEIVSKPRPLSAEENAALVQDARRIQLADRATLAEIEEAQKAGDVGREAGARARLKLIEEARDLNDRAARASGYEQGLGLASRRMMANDDYSLSTLKQKARVANNGELPDSVRTRLETLTKQIEEMEAKLSQKDEAYAKLKAERSIERMKREEALEGRRQRRQVSRADLDKEFVELSTAFGQKASKLHAGIDPELAVLIGKMAKNRVRAGINTVEGLVDEIHSQLKDYVEDKRDIRDAISAYGKTTEMSKADVDVRLRELKRQMRLISALEDAQSGKRPLRSGLQRDTQSERVKELQREVDQVMREQGLKIEAKPADPAQQQKSVLDGLKTRLRSEIAELDKRLQGQPARSRSKPIARDAAAEALEAERDTLKRSLEDPTEKNKEGLRKRLAETERRLSEKDYSTKEAEFPSKIYDDAEATQIRARLSDLNKQLASARLTPERQAELARSALEKEITELERRIAQKDFSPRAKRAPLSTPELEVLRARKDKLRAEYDALKPPTDPLPALKTRLTKQIAELEAQLASGNFAKPKSRTPLVYDREGEALKAQRDRLRTQADAEIRRLERSQRHPVEKIADMAVRFFRNIRLSGLTTIFKLTNAVGSRVGLTPIEEVVGSGLKHLPYVSRVAEKAPREGYGFNPRAERSALSHTFSGETLSEARQALKTGKSNLDIRFGDKSFLNDPEVLAVVSHAHSALKTPAKINEFYRASVQRAEHAAREAIKGGMSAEDAQAYVERPDVALGILKNSYDDALRAVLLNDTGITSAYNTLLGAAMRRGPLGKAVGYGMRFVFPVTRTPTNLTAEVTSYAAGGMKAFGKLVARGGVENLTPAEADYVMRNLKKQVVGVPAALATLTAVAYFGAKYIQLGGYYQQGDNKKNLEVKAGEAKVFGVPVPKWAMHTPLLDYLQMVATMKRVHDDQVKKNGDSPWMTGIWRGIVGVASEIPFYDFATRAPDRLEDWKNVGKFAGEEARSAIIPPDVQRIARGGVPFTGGALGDLGPTGQPVNRKSNTFFEAIQEGVPFARRSLSIGPVFGTRPTKGSDEVQRLGITVRGVERKDDESQAEYVKRRDAMNPSIGRAINETVSSPYYDKLSDEDKRKVIREAIRDTVSEREPFGGLGPPPPPHH